MPAHFRFSRIAAAIVVPQPQNGSSTRSPSLLEARMMRCSSATGFCVGYPSFSREKLSIMMEWSLSPALQFQVSSRGIPGPVGFPPPRLR